MQGGIEFDYYYGCEAEQFAFYRIPKVLFSDDYFRELSSDAKILYGLMLDRMGLSMKNGWFDEENKVYIIFTLEQVMECLNCGKDKGVKILAELDSNKGIGLIERKKQGLGKPTLIYVKNFIVQERQSSEKPKSADEERRSGEITEKEDRIDKESMSAVVSRIQEFGKIGVQTSEKPKSGVVENRSQEFGKTDTNNNNITNTDFTNTNLINQSELHEKQSHDMIWKDVAEAYTKIIHENIEYPCLIRDYRQGDIDELVDLMLEVVCIPRKIIWIAGAEQPYQLVKSKFLRIDYSHIQYVMDCLKQNTNKIHNIKSYLMTVLYNAPSTLNQYYSAEVNHDLYGCG